MVAGRAGSETTATVSGASGTDSGSAPGAVLKVLLKSDVHGSAEALEHALTGLSTEKVKLEVVRAGVGGVTESDVNLAKAGDALIVGFRVRPVGKAAELAAREGVAIKTYDVIYDVLEDVRRAMEGLLEPIAAERRLGSLEVREVFRIPRQGQVAGCVVTEGRIRRHAAARVIRGGTVVHDGDVRSLRRFKEDVTEVAQGYECGVTLSGFDDFELGDVLEVYEIVYEAQTL